MWCPSHEASDDRKPYRVFLDLPADRSDWPLSLTVVVVARGDRPGLEHFRRVKPGTIHCRSLHHKCGARAARDGSVTGRRQNTPSGSSPESVTRARRTEIASYRRAMEGNPSDVLRRICVRGLSLKASHLRSREERGGSRTPRPTGSQSRGWRRAGVTRARPAQDALSGSRTV
jgi:hypothetical protein